MKVTFLPLNNNFNCSKNQHTNVNFEAGLTPKMMQEIQQADAVKISKKLAEKVYQPILKAIELLPGAVKKH